MMTHYIKTYPFGLLLALAIAMLSLVPIPEIPAAEDVPLADKWTHMVLFGGIASVTLFELAMNRRLQTVWRWVAPTLAALYGGLIEVLQGSCTTTRSGDWYDFLADAFGVLVCAPIAYLICRKISRKENRIS